MIKSIQNKRKNSLDKKIQVELNSKCNCIWFLLVYLKLKGECIILMSIP